MKILIVLLITLNTFAGTISFIGPCEKSPLATHTFTLDKSSNVGQVTIDILNEYEIAHQGNEEGINSIFNTPTGANSMEVISTTEILAYGWCYSINGFEPAELPNMVKVEQDDHILWWFGYAHYKDGEWIAQCNPSYERRSPKFCP